MDAITAEKEKHLYGVKWFDYRRLTPDTATLVFLRDFAEALTDFNELTGKTKYFSFLKSVNNFEPDVMRENNPQFFSTLELLRQRADAGGYDYKDFWAWAFESLNDLGFQVTYLNAFLNAKLRNKIKERKDEYEKHFISRSHDPYFKAENYIGTELQDDYYSYLYMSTKHFNKGDRAAILRAFVSEGEISPDYLERHSINYSIA